MYEQSFDDLPPRSLGRLDAGVELLKAMRDHNAGDPLGRFAAHLLIEIEADRHVLEELIQRTGDTPSGVKELGAWLTEKVSRLKLKHGSGEGLGTLEALEFLMLGIHGKLALWRALSVIAPFDSRLKTTDLNQLIARAESQHVQVDEQRLTDCCESTAARSGGDGEAAYLSSLFPLSEASETCELIG